MSQVGRHHFRRARRSEQDAGREQRSRTWCVDCGRTVWAQPGESERRPARPGTRPPRHCPRASPWLARWFPARRERHLPKDFTCQGVPCPASPLLWHEVPPPTRGAGYHGSLIHARAVSAGGCEHVSPGPRTRAVLLGAHRERDPGPPKLSPPACLHSGSLTPAAVPFSLWEGVQKGPRAAAAFNEVCSVAYNNP